MKLHISADTIYKAVIKSSNGRWDSMVEQALHRLGCRATLNPSLVAQVITEGLQHHHGLALGFFNWASQQPGYTHNSKSYEALIQSLKDVKQFKTIEKLIKQMKLQRLELTPSLFTNVVSMQLEAKRANEAYRNYREMRRLRYGLSENVFNSLLGGLASGGWVDLASEVYRDMRCDGVRVSDVSFGVFVVGLCRAGEVRMVLEIIEGAKGIDQCFRGSIIATFVINGLCKAKRVDEAWWALEELRARGCKPDFVAYQIVVEALRDGGRFDEAQGLLKQKRKLSVAPFEHEYKDFIVELVGENWIREAHEIAGLIRRTGFQLDEDAFNVLIGSIANTDVEAALLLFQEMLNAGHLPTSLTLSNLVQGLCGVEKLDEVWLVFEDLLQKGFVRDVPCYNFMVSWLCKIGKIKEAYKVLETMRKNEVHPEVETYNALMDACCKADMLRPARRLWDEMFREGCHPNAQTYSILIVKFSKVGEIEEAGNLFKQMLQKGVAPDAFTYRYVIDSLTKVNKLDEAQQIYNDYMESGLA